MNDRQRQKLLNHFYTCSNDFGRKSINAVNLRKILRLTTYTKNLSTISMRFRKVKNVLVIIAEDFLTQAKLKIGLLIIPHYARVVSMLR